MKRVSATGTAYVEKLSRWAMRRRRAVLVGFALLAGLAGWRTSLLHLKTNLAELLPQGSPAVTTLRRMDKDLESIASIEILVRSPEREANRRFVDALVPALRRISGSQIAAVEWGVRDEREFYQHNGYLYASLDDLKDAKRRLQREILKRENPAFVDLGEDTQTALPDLVDDKSHELLSRFPDDHFATADGTLYAVVVRLNGSLLAQAIGANTVAAIEKAVRTTDPHRFRTDMRVDLTGNVISALEERQALEGDLELASTACLVLVGLVMFIFFRAVSPMLSSVVPALAGVLCAMALAQLAFKALNSSTAFMGSIILGNGINYAIIQTARYEEERRRGLSAQDAASVAVRTTWRATGIAALGAAVSYGALSLTSFRGFSQFGTIGGAGMVLSWLATLIVLPAVWACCDRRNVVPGKGRAFAGFTRWLANLTVRAPMGVLLTGAAISVVCLAALPHYAHDPFEYNFRKLGNQSRARNRVEVLSGKLNPIFGRTLSPGIILCDNPAEAEPVKQALRARDPNHDVIAKIVTIADLLPGDLPLQMSKLQELDGIRRLLDKNADLLNKTEREKLDKLRPPSDLRPIRPVDLPIALRRYFTERDGTIGRPVLYFAPMTVSIWDGRYLLQLARLVQSIRLPDGRTLHSSGSGVIFADMLRAIVHDGPRVTGAALFGVMMITVLLLGLRTEAALTVATLLVGALWMVGAAALFHVRINFLNFVALPVTFGIGVDYGINLLERYRLEEKGGVARAVVGTGGAVALCSFTTIIGYAALLLADNHALRSFGAMAIMGEFACVAAALSLLPSLLIAIEDSHGPRPHVTTPATGTRSGGIGPRPTWKW